MEEIEGYMYDTKDNYMNEIERGLHTGFINKDYNSNLAYRPEFISNNYKHGKKVLSSIEQELSNCDEFYISVAFITLSGITPLLQILKELEEKNIQGRILTTDYLTFSEPKALEKLASLKNIQLKMFCTNEKTGGFHTKGYIFRKEEVYRIIIGSSNLTLYAITKNREWNTKLVATKNGALVQDITGEFEELWNDKSSQEYSSFIEKYKEAYIRRKLIKEQQSISKEESVVDFEQYNLKPNKMQEAFISNLLELISNKADRALLISATGTGKTYASAFALRTIKPKKALFLVHREQIAKQAIKSYKKVFGKSKSFGLLSGNSKEIEADFLFSTMQMMAKSEIRQKFSIDEFQTIIIDEVHRAGAESYKKIIEYFKPNFWLGMTASPDRTDGFDIYSLFDHNIAYEITLQQALEEDLLCPFHYFGITDIEINGEIFDDNSCIRKFTNLVCDERVAYIIEKANYYGFSGDRLKGLIFCSGKKEGEELSTKFNKRGFHTKFLCGDTSQEDRENSIERLVSDDRVDYLDYIFTVDIFNEGVDIPEINQVIMLRPTKSPTIFIQQLGRGLRKSENKEYVIILDFIGNYMNNFMIPIALSGDRSYNKDNMRRYISEGTRIIPGSSTIHFDEVSRKRIYSSIDSARTNDIRLFRESYFNLKMKLGKIPLMQDFDKYGEIDITKIFEKCNSYYSFLKKYESEYNITLSEDEEIIIEFLSRKAAKGKRIYELELLKNLIKRKERFMNYYRGVIKEKYNIILTIKEEESVIRYLTNQFPKEEEKKKFNKCIFIEQNDQGDYSISSYFRELLKHKEFKEMCLDVIELGINRYYNHYSQRYKETNFQLYQKYTYEDVCRLLNWKRNMNAQNIGGYFYDVDTKTLPVFINYEKSINAIAYEDRFISDNELIALSKHPRKINSSDVKHIYKRSKEDTDNRIYLFVRKNKDDKEAKEFYFLGEIYAEGNPTPIRMNKTNDDAFEINYRLDVPVREDIYDYIKGGN